MSVVIGKEHIAVLMGGLSAEKEVSMESGEACAAALERLGYKVTKVEMDRNLAAKLTELKPDKVFNALHGRFGEDGRVQGMLDILNITYTHSGHLASALAMDKPLTKTVLKDVGIQSPAGRTMSIQEVIAQTPFTPPFVMKPANEGSSVGVSIVGEGDHPVSKIGNDTDLNTQILVEEFIPGRELTCSVLKDQALAVTEICPTTSFYDYYAKYTDGVAQHVVPADIPKEIEEQVKTWSVLAHKTLGCKTLSRSDFRYNPDHGDQGLYFLEINTQPGMTSLSLLPEQASYVGISFDDLVQTILDDASCE